MTNIVSLPRGSAPLLGRVCCSTTCSVIGRKTVKVVRSPSRLIALDPTPVLQRDAVDGGQPQPGAFVDGFGGEEGVEDAALSFPIHAGAIICHPDPDEGAGPSVG